MELGSKSNSNGRGKPKPSSKEKPAKPTPSKDSSASSQADKKQKTGEFICKLKYQNNLPPIPFDPKLLNYPFDKNRFIKYFATSLDKNYKSSLHNEPDLGIPIDLIDPASYKAPAKAGPIDPEDLRLLDPVETNGESTSKSPAKGTGVRAKIVAPRVQVPWLKKTQYISGAADTTRVKFDAVESKSGIKHLNDTELVRVKARDEQIKSIEDTFAAAKLPPKHPHNDKLTVKEVLPLYPDFDLWPNIYTQVVVEKDKVHDEERAASKQNAIIKAYVSDTGTKFFAYLVPKKKRKLDEEENAFEDEEYEWVREYSYDVKKGNDYLDCYFFKFEDNNVYFNEIGTRVNLFKLKSKEGIPQPSKISTVYKDLDDDERRLRDARENDLLQTELLESLGEEHFKDGEEEEIRDEPDEMKDD